MSHSGCTNESNCGECWEDELTAGYHWNARCNYCTNAATTLVHDQRGDWHACPEHAAHRPVVTCRCGHLHDGTDERSDGRCGGTDPLGHPCALRAGHPPADSDRSIEHVCEDVVDLWPHLAPWRRGG